MTPTRFGIKVASSGSYKYKEQHTNLCSGGIALYCGRWCVGEFNSLLGAFEKLRKAAISFVMRVHPSAWNSASAGRIFMKFGIWLFLDNLWRKF